MGEGGGGGGHRGIIKMGQFAFLQERVHDHYASTVDVLVSMHQ